MVGTWWNHEIIKAKAQISAISGRIIEQTVNFVGKKQIELLEKTYNALHLKFYLLMKHFQIIKNLIQIFGMMPETLIWVKAILKKQEIGNID